MTAIVQALGAGYSAKQILSYLSQHNPRLAQQITTALNAGHSLDHVLNFISRNEKRIGKLVPEKAASAGNLYKEAQANVHPALRGIAQFAGTAAALTGGAYALSRAMPNSLMQTAIQPSQILPALPQQSGLPAPQQQLGLPSPQQMQGNVNPQPSPTAPTQPGAQTVPQPQQTQSLQSGTKTVNVHEVLNRHDSLAKIDNLIKSGNGPKEVSGFFRKFHSQIVKNIEKEAGLPFEKVIEDYIISVPQQPKEQIPTGQNQLKSNELVEPENKVASPELAQNLKKPFEESPSIANEPQKIDKDSLVSTPHGVGEIKSDIRGGQAIVEVSGKKYKVDVDEMEGQPEDLEEATRHLMKLIPENLKSTAIQSSTRVQLPGNLSVTFMKFYDGKIAWYLDVPEDIYKSIALGIYEPKTKKKTGIGEYKPGVIDSRGAGFHEQIRMNPLYSKANKGKTWGYADNDYDALSIIQPILHKMSREEYDEEGKLIEKKRKKPA